MAKRRNGKAIGNNFENRICKILSLNWTDGKNDAIFHRTDNSGGRATVRRANKKDDALQASDIGFNDPDGKPLIDIWNIEVKKGYKNKKYKSKVTGEIRTSTWDILDLLDGQEKQTVFEMFWEQTNKEAELTNRIPILIFSRTNKGICIALEKWYFNKIMKCKGFPQFHFLEFCGVIDITIVSLKDFLDWTGNLKTILGVHK